jgi:hypothetical protein
VRWCTVTNNLDTGEGLWGGWSGLWASDLREGCHSARPGQAQAAPVRGCLLSGRSGHGVIAEGRYEVAPVV